MEVVSHRAPIEAVLRRALDLNGLYSISAINVPKMDLKPSNKIGIYYSNEYIKVGVQSEITTYDTEKSTCLKKFYIIDISGNLNQKFDHTHILSSYCPFSHYYSMYELNDIRLTFINKWRNSANAEKMLWGSAWIAAHMIHLYENEKKDIFTCINECVKIYPPTCY